MDEARRIADLLDRVARAAHGKQFCGGLNPAQWEALRYLARANKYSRSPGAMAEYLGATRGTVSQTLIALETKGYVRKCRDGDDRRSVLVSLTPEGEAVLRRDPFTALGEAVGALTVEERRALARALPRVVDHLQGERGSCGFGLCHECCHLKEERPPEAAAAAASGPPPFRCGITGEALRPEELDQICVDFRS